MPDRQLWSNNYDRDFGDILTLSSEVARAKGWTRDAITPKALAKLETMAKENGLAIGVGTSLPVTIQQVSKWSKTLGDKNVVLIPVSAAVTAQHQS